MRKCHAMEVGYPLNKGGRDEALDVSLVETTIDRLKSEFATHSTVVGLVGHAGLHAVEVIFYRL